MKDFSAIETELKTAFIGLTKFLSTETGHIRENVPNSQMPSLDISCVGMQYNFYDAEAQYKIPCVIVIRKYGPDRREAANEFKELVESLCAILETLTGTAFAVVRNIDASIQEYAGDTSGIVRTGVIQITLWA